MGPVEVVVARKGDPPLKLLPTAGLRFEVQGQPGLTVEFELGTGVCQGVRDTACGAPAAAWRFPAPAALCTPAFPCRMLVRDCGQMLTIRCSFCPGMQSQEVP